MPSKKQSKADAARYADIKSRTGERNRRASAAGRDIGSIPPVKDVKRRDACRDSFRQFCEVYGAESFPLAWSADHLTAIAKIEAAVLRGELFAFAMPRGSGKSTLSIWACLWACLYGHRSFVMLVGSDQAIACQMLDTLKSHLEQNDLLAEDFPAACYPVRALDGITARVRGQTCEGEPTHMGWTADKVTLPWIGKAASAGAAVRVAGITGRIRGVSHTRPDGKTIRPDLCLIDDPQTDEALDVDTLIPCLDGFKKLADIKVGDVVFDENGKQCNVIDTTGAFVGRQCYRVDFDDGTSVVADAGHLWTTSTQLQRTNQRRKKANPNPAFSSRPQCRPHPYCSVRTTEEIRDTLLTAKDQRANHSISFCAVLDVNEKTLPIDPYALGAWLGDGLANCGRVCGADPEIFQEIDKAYARVSTNNNRGDFWYVNYAGLAKLLRINGLKGNKHIPSEYMISSASQRLALLQGLMDTDGSVSSGILGVKGTRCTFSNTNYRLISGVAFLCRSLGIKATVTEIRRTPQMTSPGWKVNFITSLPVFRLTRKLQKLPALTRKDTTRRYVVAVTPVESRPVRCIKVDSASQIFLCGEGLIATHNSSASPSQVATRERILAGAILGLSGPGKKIAGLATITVIRPDDLADRLLDRMRHPSWQGERTKLVYEWPTADELWGQYAEMRREGQRSGEGTAAADAFYASQQATMDAGSRVAWPERKHDDELSAIQHAWNLRIDRGESAFQAEYQNAPLADDISSEKLDKRSLAARALTLPRGTVPLSHQTLTAFIDVQDKLLYWLVASWGESFGGHVVAYGTYPDQASTFFEAKNAKKTLALAAKGAGFEGALSAGLESLTQILLGRDWLREDGVEMRVRQVCVDANWGQSTEVVRTFCRRSTFTGSLLPTHGKGIGASGGSLTEKKGRGEKLGLNWVMRQTATNQRYGVYETNFWKTFSAARLRLTLGDPEAITLHAGDHDMLIEHLTSEYPVRTEARGRVVDEWKLDNRRENHWWDCLVGSAVAASISGVHPVATEAGGRQRKKVTIPTNANGKKVIQVKRLK
jgi:hypothetical protein